MNYYWKKVIYLSSIEKSIFFLISMILISLIKLNGT